MIIFSEQDTALCFHFKLLVFVIQILWGGGGLTNKTSHIWNVNKTQTITDRNLFVKTLIFIVH